MSEELETRPVLPDWADGNEEGQGLGLSGDTHGVETTNEAVSTRHQGSGWYDSGGTASVMVGGMSHPQRIACYLSHVLSLVCIIFVVVWISDDAMGGGGLAWAPGEASKVFNWHPLLMVTAFAFMTVASMAFRVATGGGRRSGSSNASVAVAVAGKVPGIGGSLENPHRRRRIFKTLHGVQWTVAGLCGAVGILAVFRSHNDGVSGYIANMYSLHSWIGMGVVLLYLYQFFSATLAFAVSVPFLGPVQRSKILSFHRFLGTYVYVFTAATILLGIQEKEGFMGGCSYSIVDDRPDTTPWTHYGEVPRSCHISHGLGLVVFFTTVCTVYALYNFPENQEIFTS